MGSRLFCSTQCKHSGQVQHVPHAKLPISAALYTVYTQLCMYTYAYIIRKGDCCTCVLFDPFNHTVTDRPSKEACIGKKLKVLIVDGITPAAHSSHVQEIVPFLLVCHTVCSNCVNSTKNP